VGPSGSGKSTVIGILLRLYDLVDGKVLIDDVEVKDWNLTLLRDQIGLVQQVRPPVP
jgi:ABC-type multidrug transport system fused ATPase/permease subunit